MVARLGEAIIAAALGGGDAATSRTPYATRFRLIRCNGEMLSDVMFPPAAPQPKVIAGNRFVVYPTAPNAAGVFTQMRNAGLRKPNSRTTCSSLVCTLRVWPRPPKFRISMHLAQ